MRGAFGGSYGIGRTGAGGGGGTGAGAGGGGGGGMLRTVRRVVRTGMNNGLQEPLPSTNSPTSPTKSSKSTKTTQKSKHALSLSSPWSTNNCLPLPVSAAWPPSRYPSVDYEVDDQWECVENYDGDLDNVFGEIPSTHEVQHALFSLQQVISSVSSSHSITGETPDFNSAAGDVVQRASSISSDLDWVEPSMHLYDRRLVPSYGLDRVYDAFNLLQNEPSVQRMVVSLSSDKAVWDAIMNNEAVKEIRDSYRHAAEISPRSSDENGDLANTDPNVLKWIFENMKAKFLEVLGNITQFVGDIFKPVDHEKFEYTEAFMDKLRPLFLLTVVVSLIVVVTRGHKA